MALETQPTSGRRRGRGRRLELKVVVVQDPDVAKFDEFLHLLHGLIQTSIAEAGVNPFSREGPEP